MSAVGWRDEFTGEPEPLGQEQQDRLNALKDKFKSALRQRTAALKESDRSGDALAILQATCEHEWHYFGTINGKPDIACQSCGLTKPDA
jgi:hypothetical protein